MNKIIEISKIEKAREEIFQLANLYVKKQMVSTNSDMTDGLNIGMAEAYTNALQILTIAINNDL